MGVQNKNYVLIKVLPSTGVSQQRRRIKKTTTTNRAFKGLANFTLEVALALVSRTQKSKKIKKQVWSTKKNSPSILWTRRIQHKQATRAQKAASHGHIHQEKMSLANVVWHILYRVSLVKLYSTCCNIHCGIKQQKNEKKNRVGKKNFSKHVTIVWRLMWTSSLDSLLLAEMLISPHSNIKVKLGVRLE